MVAKPKLNYRCLSPKSDPGNHGSDPTKSLQVAPFQSESNTIWIGYHDQPSRKYLGVFPSFDEVTDRCRRNVVAGSPNTLFPRHNTTVSDGTSDKSECLNPERYSRSVCCIACQEETTDCERLGLEFIPVNTGCAGRKEKVFLIVYKFYLRGERMVALLHHSNRGKHFFQKTDGTLSNAIALDTKHSCHDLSQSAATLESEDESDTSSLTQFDCVEDEDTTNARPSPRMSLRSSQRHYAQEPTSTLVAPTPQTPLMQQELPAQSRVRGRVVIDITDEDEPSPVKEEKPEYSEHMMASIPCQTPSVTPASTPSIAHSEGLSFSDRFGPDPLAEEYGRITTQMVQEYSMRVFALPEVKGLMQRMKQAVKAGDRPALCRAYGALQAFLITVE